MNLKINLINNLFNCFNLVKKIGAFGIVLCAVYSPSLAQKNVNPGSLEKEFPLMAWDYADNEKSIKDMHDCGINLLAFAPPSILDLCSRYKMKAILFDSGILRSFDAPFIAKTANITLRKLIQKYNKHPALYGYHLKDEPDAKDFPELAKSVALVKNEAPGKWPYINLFPNFPFGNRYAPDYLDKFAEICQPTAISYDNYVQDYNSLNGDKSIFWDNLAEVRASSLKYDLPFWNIVLTAPHLIYEEFTDAALRLQMFGSLAYGAKGLCFYKFISASLPIYNAPDLGNFRMAPIDQFGERTHTFDNLRNINRQIANMGSTLLKLKSDYVYHLHDVPKGHNPASDKTFIKEIPGEGRYIVGDFTHEDGSKYVMIVNKSVTKSAPCNPVFNGGTKKVQIVSPWKGKLENYTGGFFYLAPGQGILLKIG